MMSAVPVIRISRPHGNTAVLLWTGGENIRFFAAAGWLMFRKTSAVRAEQQEAMQTVSRQFSSGHDNVNIKFTKNDRLKITNFDHIYSSRESRTSFVL